MPKVQALVLRGVPVEWEDFSADFDRDVDSRTGVSKGLVNRLAELRAWADAELATRHTMIAVVLGCGVHGNRDLPPAQWSQLMKLRGDGNIDVRMRIARCLGVRSNGAELGCLRAAAAGWRGLEGQYEPDEGDY